MTKLLAVFIGGLMATYPLSAAERWTPEAMMQVVAITDVQPSPDGKQTLHTALGSVLDENDSYYYPQVWRGSTAKDNVILLEGKPTKMGRWSPDGKLVAFLAIENGIANLYIGDRQITKGNTSIQSYRWSPDSKNIAYVRQDPVNEQKVDYYNAADIKGNSLWVVDVASATEKQMTQPPFYLRGAGDLNTLLEDFDWSPDSKEIAFGYMNLPSKDCFYLHCSLATVNADTGEIIKLSPDVDHESVPRYSHDGKWLAYLQSDQPATYATTRYVVVRDRNSGEKKQLAKTAQEGPYLTGPSLLGWSSDDQNVLFFEPNKTRFQLYALPIDGGQPTEIGPTDKAVYEANLNAAATHIGFVTQTMSVPPEAAISTLGEKKSTITSGHNHDFMSYPVVRSEIIRWNSPDGTNIEGILTYPINFKEGNKYPLLVIVHGGPMVSFTEYYVGLSPVPYPIAAFAQEGYFVLRPNPRGSAGYGHPFRYANYEDWGGKDYEDIIAGVDATIEKGFIEPQRLGIMGWSYGGYMTAWTVTQTNRFAAASMGAGMSNLTSMLGTTDIHNYVKDYMKGDIWEKPKLYWERSPVSHANKIETPLLIQHGDTDKRVPISQAYEFYESLLRQGKTVQFMIHPRAEHRPTEPQHMLEILQQNLAWFNQHLKQN